MKLDIFNHIMPKTYFDKVNSFAASLGDLDKRMKGNPLLIDLDSRLKWMDQIEDYTQVLSLAAPPIELLAGPELAPELARVANDSMAEIVARHPDRFPGFIASLPLNNPDASEKEVDRAIRDLKAVGIQVFTNIQGKPLDLPEFLPIFEKMAGYDLPIWIHPARGANFPDYKTEDKSKYEIWWAVGWPYETSVAMIRIVFARFFDRWPELKIITHHMGAMIPFNEGRLGPGYDVLGSRSPGENYGELLKQLKKRPLDYFRMFYADTATFGARLTVKCGLEFFGADKVLFATDFPLVPKSGYGSVQDAIGLVEELPVSAEDRSKIFETNARKLMKI
jgi:predicted TIM-barrel fold metal-dependent hydrolase